MRFRSAALPFTFQSEMVERTIARQGQQPGNEGAAIGLILAGIAPQLEENILHDFLGRRGLLQDAQNQRINDAGMPVVELFESAHVPVKKLDH